MTRKPSALAAVLLAAVLVSPAARAQTSAPADAESYERSLREERVRHLDVTRRLADEEERLRAALDAAKGRLAEAEARTAALRKLVGEVEAAAAALVRRVDESLAALQAVASGIAAAAQRFGPKAAVPAEALDERVPLARRLRLVFQAIDREIASARAVSVSARERSGVLGHEVKLGILGRFFVPAAGGRALHEPSGRELGEPVGAALREVVRQATKRGRGTLVQIPWWGGE